MKITTICNPNSPYFQKKVKIRNHHPNEEVEVFVLEDELLIFVKLEHLTPDEEVFKPSSRKDFYEFVQNPSTSRSQMVATLKYLTNKKLIVLNQDTSEQSLVSLFNSLEKDLIVEEFRKLRDEGKLDFKLANNSNGIKNKFKQKYKKN